jgi:hypothetical protein
MAGTPASGVVAYETILSEAPLSGGQDELVSSAEVKTLAGNMAGGLACSANSAIDIFGKAARRLRELRL